MNEQPAAPEPGPSSNTAPESAPTPDTTQTPAASATPSTEPTPAVAGGGAVPGRPPTVDVVEPGAEAPPSAAELLPKLTLPNGLA